LSEANLKVAYYQKLDLKEKSLISKGRATNSVGFSKRIEHVEAEVKAFKKKREELLSLTKKQYALAHKKHPKARYQLFLLYLSEGKLDAAIELYKNEADSGDTYALTRMGEVAFAQGHQERAQALWEEAAKKGQKEARYNFAKHYTRLADHTLNSDGDRDAALSWLQKAEALFNEAAEYAEAAYELGKICCNQGTIGQAVLHFQHAAANGHIEAHCKLDLINKTKGNKTASLHHFGYAAAQGNKWALYHLGRYAQQEGNTEKALRYHRRAVLAENDCAAYLLYEMLKGFP
jgi:tetratricopeptide (TPR) repeat protein